MRLLRTYLPPAELALGEGSPVPILSCPGEARILSQELCQKLDSQRGKTLPASDSFSLECDGDTQLGNFILRAECCVSDGEQRGGPKRASWRRPPRRLLAVDCRHASGGTEHSIKGAPVLNASLDHSRISEQPASCSLVHGQSLQLSGLLPPTAAQHNRESFLHVKCNPFV